VGTWWHMQAMIIIFMSQKSRNQFAELEYQRGSTLYTLNCCVDANVVPSVAKVILSDSIRFYHLQHVTYVTVKHSYTCYLEIIPGWMTITDFENQGVYLRPGLWWSTTGHLWLNNWVLQSLDGIQKKQSVVLRFDSWRPFEPCTSFTSCTLW